MKQIKHAKVAELFGELTTLFPIKATPQIIALYATGRDWNKTVWHWVHTETPRELYNLIIVRLAPRPGPGQTVLRWILEGTTRKEHNSKRGWCIKVASRRNAYNRFPAMVHPSFRHYLNYDFVIVVRVPSLLDRIQIELTPFRIWGKMLLRRHSTPHNPFYRLKETLRDCRTLKDTGLTNTLIHELIHVIDYCNHTQLLTDNPEHDRPIELLIYKKLQSMRVNLKFHW
jgi:hypothetical protein